MNRWFGLLLVIILVAPTWADEWPQWMGPGRDNVWRETGIIDKFPAGGPPIVWRAEIAGGYAGPAVAQGKVFVTDFVTSGDAKAANFDRNTTTGTERVLCLDAKTGEQLWSHEYDVTYTISYPAGPRCTPNVDGDYVYTLGAEGHLFCFKTETGEVAWSKDFKTDYGTESAMWGYAGHPLIDGDKLICVVGGSGSHAVALNKNTGEELWRTLTASEQGYSPPTIIQAGGRRQLILLRPDAVSSVDPETGEEFWSIPYQATSGSIIMSPIQWNNYLYAAGYSNKNILLKLDADEPDAEVEWQDVGRHGISPVNVQPFRVENIIYGFDQGGQLMAIELPSGRRLWKTSEADWRASARVGTAFIFQQADRFWMFNENGELLIARLSPDGYEEIDRAKVIEPTNVAFGRDVVWSNPAFAYQRAFIRNDEELICVNLAAE